MFGFGTGEPDGVKRGRDRQCGLRDGVLRGIGTTFTGNAVSGSQDAGIYIGDSLDASAVVSEKPRVGQRAGYLVRHARRAVVSDNEAGKLHRRVPAGGWPGRRQRRGRGAEQHESSPTMRCARNLRSRVPACPRRRRYRSRGVAAQRDLSERRARQPGQHAVLGRIVLIATPRANGRVVRCVSNNLVFLNRLRGNEPAEIVNDEAARRT